MQIDYILQHSLHYSDNIRELNDNSGKYISGIHSGFTYTFDRSMRPATLPGVSGIPFRTDLKNAGIRRRESKSIGTLWIYRNSGRHYIYAPSGIDIYHHIENIPYKGNRSS